MTVSTNAFLKQTFNLIKGLGDKSVSSDAMFVIDGFEEVRLLTKQFPWPTSTIGGEIAVPTPMGGESWQPQQVKFNHQGPVTFHETVRGDVASFLDGLLAIGGRFDATVYEGTLEHHVGGRRITNCFFQLDNPDRDWENRSQITQISGTLFYHYFGDKIPGNASAL